MNIFVMGSMSRSLINFRAPLLRELCDRGHRVIAAGPQSGVEAELEELGAEFLQAPLSRTGRNPLVDARLVCWLVRVLRREKIDLYLGYTVKPVVYGCIAARLAGVPRRHALITGLGTSFLAVESASERIVSYAVSQLYRVALRQVSGVMFQNPDDQELFRSSGLLPCGVWTTVIPGSGVDLEHFGPEPYPSGPPMFLLISRLVENKGIREFVSAARIVRRNFPRATFRIVGPTEEHPAALPTSLLSAWSREEGVTFTGESADVREHLRECTAFVLPSYREGLSRSILEAMATARAIVTTDVPGCRQTVEHGVNGLLVPPRDVDALASALCTLATAPLESERMGRESRRLVEERFGLKSVTSAMLSAMGVLPGTASAAKV